MEVIACLLQRLRALKYFNAGHAGLNALIAIGCTKAHPHLRRTDNG
jgi:hypothetical protein